MKMPSVTMMRVSDVHVADGRRAIREEAIPPLMESIKRLGLQVPICVRIVDEMDLPGEGIVCNVPVLVAGRHRLEAASRLGWETLPAVEMNDERDARLWEISENLHRAELAPVDRAEQIDEWRRLTVEKGANVSHPSGGKQPHEKGYVKTAESLGVSKDTVRNAAKIANLPEEIREQARAEDWTQSRLLNEARARDPVRAEKPVPPPPPVRNDAEAEDQWLGSILRLWNKAPLQWRERFLEEVGA